MIYAMNAYWIWEENVLCYGVFSTIVLLYNCQFVFPPWPLSFRICMCLRSDSRIYILLKRMSLINFESTANILIKSNIKYTQLHIKWIQTRWMIKKKLQVTPFQIFYQQFLSHQKKIRSKEKNKRFYSFFQKNVPSFVYYFEPFFHRNFNETTTNIICPILTNKQLVLQVKTN